MSNLLEQAIIDAEALKQAAYKSAEASLVEKFSKELKESVEKLLEQEETAPETPETPEAPSMEIPGGNEQAQESSSNAFDNVPSSFLDGPDDELITISFDEIKKQISKTIGGDEAQSVDVSDGSIEMPPEQAAANAAQPPEAPVQAEPQAIQEHLDKGEQFLLDEEIELDEEILAEMSSCGSDYKKKNKNEMEEGMGGDLDSSGDNDLEEEMQVGQTSGPTALNAAKEQSEQQAEKMKDKTDHNKKITDATGNLSKAEAAVKTFETQLDTAKKTRQLAQQELARLRGENLSEEADVHMDYDPFSDTSGYLRTSKQDQNRQFNSTLAKIKISLKEEISKFIKENFKLKSDLNSLKQEKNIFEKELSDYRQIAFQLKEQVEKLSISNAKLLYTNKVFEDVSLNERQKETVVENLSRAKSVNEAKTIYETLQSTVQTVSNKKQKQSLSEALDRGSTPFAVRSKQFSQDDALSERMKILAGIKN